MKFEQGSSRETRHIHQTLRMVTTSSAHTWNINITDEDIHTNVICIQNIILYLIKLNRLILMKILKKNYLFWEILNFEEKLLTIIRSFLFLTYKIIF